MMLSFVGAKGCFGGDVDMGGGAGGSMATGGLAGTTATGGSGNALATGGAIAAGGSTATGGSSGYAGSISATGGGMATGATGGKEGAAGGSPTEVDLPIVVDTTGFVAGPLGVTGPWYGFSDGWGEDGVAANGDCEKAGHAASECASIQTPPYGSFPNVGGVMCTQGTTEQVLDITGQTGCPSTTASCDFANMWGAGIGFDLADTGTAPRGPFNASAVGIVGFAFDIDQVPASGIRLMVSMPTTESVAHVYQPESGSGTSPLVAGHNKVMFATDLAQPSYVPQAQVVPFDPTQVVAIQFQMLSRTDGVSNYAFCISNFSFITEQTAVSTCPNGAPLETGYQYATDRQCVLSTASKLGCRPPTADAPTIPAQPAIPDFPCARRISDGALFVALDNASGPFEIQQPTQSSWAHLSPTEWADCTADEASLVSSSSVCPVNAF